MKNLIAEFFLFIINKYDQRYFELEERVRQLELQINNQKSLEEKRIKKIEDKVFIKF